MLNVKWITLMLLLLQIQH